MTYQGRALIPLLVQEREKLALTIQIRQRRPAEQLHEIVAEQRTVDPLFEILFAPREVIGILRRDALQAGQNIPRDDHNVERIGPDVRIAVHVDVALGPRQVRGDIEERHALVGGDVSRPAFDDLGIVGLIEQRRDP